MYFYQPILHFYQLSTLFLGLDMLTVWRQQEWSVPNVLTYQFQKENCKKNILLVAQVMTLQNF